MPKKGAMKAIISCPQTISECLKQLLKDASKEFSLEEILHALSGRGYPLLLLFLTLPFCIPITIPGMSTPFGIAIALSGLRLAFAQHPWWPQSILKRSIPRETLEKWVIKIEKTEGHLKRFVRPRLLVVTQNPLFHRIHGLNICCLGILLALPLPIPMSNMLAGIPLVMMSLGLLENDGWLVISSYIFSIICYAAFGFIFWLGTHELLKLFHF